MSEKWRKIGALAPMTCKKKSAILVLSKAAGWTKNRFCELIKSFCEAVIFMPGFKKRRVHMLKRIAIKWRVSQWYWSVVVMASLAILSLQPVYASVGGNNIWSRFSAIMKDVYGQLVGISTIVAVTAASVALLVRMISRNQRAVDEASSWLKRIIVTWIVLNTLGFAVAYLQPLIQGGQYTG